MKSKIIFLVTLIMFVSLVSAIPQTFNVHGRLSNSSGIMTGIYEMNFSLYDVYTGGSYLWNDVYDVTTDSDGVYNIILTDIDLPFSAQYYLGVAVEDDSEMTPRVNLTSSGYAFRANVSDYLVAANNYEMANLTLAQKITFALGETIDNIVDGWVRITGGLTVTGDFEVDGSDFYVDSGTGRVGIGTATPNAKLQVNGSINVTTDVCVEGGACLSTVAGSSDTLDAYDSTYFMPLNKSVSGEFDFNGGWENNGLTIKDGDIYAQTGWFYNISSLEISQLEINGSIFPDLDNQFDIGSSSLRWRDLYLSGEVYSNGTGDSYFLGSVGIGTDNVSGYDLEVAGTLNAQSISINGVAVASSSDTYWSNSSSDIYYSGGSVGIGTSSPDTLLDVESSGSPVFTVQTSATSSQEATIRIRGARTTSETADISNLEFWNDESGGEFTMAEIASRNADAISGTNYSDLIFRTNNGSGLTEVMRLDDSGNVGIGTSSPTSKLDIKSAGTGANVMEIESGADTDRIFRIYDGATNAILSLYDETPTEDVRLASGGDSWFNGGNVGIGTSSPTYKFQIKELEDTVIQVWENEDGRGLFLTTPDKDVDTSPWIWETGNSYNWNVDGSIALAIDHVRNVGIGTATPSGKLDIVGGNVNIEATAPAFSIKPTSTGTASIELGKDRTGSGYSFIDLVGDTTYSDFGLRLIRHNSGANAISEISHRGTGNLKFNRVEAGDFEFSGGNVGIGTSSPDTILDVTASGANGLVLSQDTGTAANSARLFFSANTIDYAILNQDNKLSFNSGSSAGSSSGTQRVVIDSSGKVGIGTTTPSSVLDVIGDIETSGNMIMTTTAKGILMDTADGADNQQLKFSAGGAYSSTRGGIILLGGNEEATYPGRVLINPGALAGMYVEIDSTLYVRDGNVGIGTASPSEELYLYKSGGTRFDMGIEGSVADADNAIQSNIFAYATGANSGGAEKRIAGLVFMQGGSTANYRGGQIKFLTKGDNAGLSDRMVIDEGGNVGIGTSSPNYKLDIAGGATIDFRLIDAHPIMVFNETGVKEWYFGVDAGSIWFGEDSTGGGDRKLTIIPGGNVGIGVTDPDEKLEVIGNIKGTHLAITHGQAAILMDGAPASGFGPTTAGPLKRITANDGGGNFNIRSGGYFSTSEKYVADGSGAVHLRFDSDSQDGRFYIKTAGTGVSAGDPVTYITNAKFEPTLNTFTKTYFSDDVGIGTASPDTDLTIGSGTTTGGKGIHIEDHDDAYIWLEADEDNAGEDDNPYILFSQDNGAIRAVMGGVGGVNKDPINSAYTGTLDNAYMFGTLESSALQFGTSDNIRMTLDTAGDVGIGTSSPSVRLDIDTGSNVDGVRIRGGTETTDFGDLYVAAGGNFVMSTTSGTGTGAYLDFRPKNNQYGMLLRESDGTSTASYANFYVTDATDAWLSIGVKTVKDANALVVTASDRVGIGTSTPSAKLDVEVSSGGAATIGDDTNTATGNYAVAMGYDANASGLGSTAMGWGTTASNAYSTAMGIWTTASGLSSTAMGREIDVSGDYSVGIGLNNPSSDHLVTASNVMVIMGGKVGIGDSSPDTVLDVVGLISSAAGRYVCSDADGSFYYTTATCTSGLHLKENIVDYFGGLDLVMQIESKQFDLRDGGDHQAGMIAEYVEPIAPECVMIGEDNTRGLNYDCITAIQNNAIKELKVEKDLEIKGLRIENEMLKKRFDELCEKDDSYSWCK